MSTLTESVVEIADNRVSLFYLKTGAADVPLPFSSSSGYVALHQKLSAKVVDFAELRPGYQPQILKRLSPAYDNYKYWQLTLLSQPSELFPDLAWEHALPIIATVIPKIEVLKDGAASFRVLPIPRVMLYPGGWATWISLRVLDAHTLDQLATLIEKMFTTPAFRIIGEHEWLSLTALLKRFAEGIRADAYGGLKDTKDISYAAEPTLVTTVLAKHNGSPSAAALGQYEPALRRLVDPAKALSGKSVASHIHRYNAANPFEFMVFNDYARFIWLENLLEPVERQRQRLLCYHQNTFRLLVHARHLNDLLKLATKQKVRTVPLVEMVKSGIGVLNEPAFRNASFVSLLKDPDVAKTVAQALKWSKNQT